MIGESGLTTALHDEGYTLTERDPDYVVLGETRTYSFERITTAIRLILGRRPLHRHQPRPDQPERAGPTAGHRLGGGADQPRDRRRPLLHRQAQPADDALGAQPRSVTAPSETTAMIGDRMDTDIVAGLEAGLETILVLTSVTARADAERFPFRASRTLESVADLADELG